MSKNYIIYSFLVLPLLAAKCSNETSLRFSDRKFSAFNPSSTENDNLPGEEGAPRDPAGDEPIDTFDGDAGESDRPNGQFSTEEDALAEAIRLSMQSQQAHPERFSALGFDNDEALEAFIRNLAEQEAIRNGIAVYAKSEAEMFRIAFGLRYNCLPAGQDARTYDPRRAGGGWLSQFTFDSKVISTALPPGATVERGYVIYKREPPKGFVVAPKDIQQACARVPYGLVEDRGNYYFVREANLAQRDLQTIQEGVALDFTEEEHWVEIRDVPSADSETRNFSKEQHGNIDRITALIKRGLAAPQPNGDNVYFTNGALQAGLRNALDAIATRDESVFVNNMRLIAAAFPPRGLEAREGFIGSFVALYVTFLFPSEYLKKSYLHFIMNCGGCY